GPRAAVLRRNRVAIRRRASAALRLQLAPVLQERGDLVARVRAVRELVGAVREPRLERKIGIGLVDGEPRHARRDVLVAQRDEIPEFVAFDRAADLPVRIAVADDARAGPGAEPHLPVVDVLPLEALVLVVEIDVALQRVAAALADRA